MLPNIMWCVTNIIHVDALNTFHVAFSFLTLSLSLPLSFSSTCKRTFSTNFYYFWWTFEWINQLCKFVGWAFLYLHKLLFNRRALPARACNSWIILHSTFSNRLLLFGEKTSLFLHRPTKPNKKIFAWNWREKKSTPEFQPFVFRFHFFDLVLTIFFYFFSIKSVKLDFVYQTFSTIVVT